MVAASRATSVPDAPMATPMSARRRAGASFTPSPVIATTWPSARSDSAMRSLVSGELRAITASRWSARRASRAGSVRASTCVPVATPCSGSTGMPTCRAMAAAVRPLSPVTTSTRTPAWRHRSTAAAAEARGGSTSPTTPTRRSSRSASMRSPGNGSSGPRHRSATASTLSPFWAICSTAARAPWMSSSGPQRGKMASGAPLAVTVTGVTADIRRRAESKWWMRRSAGGATVAPSILAASSSATSVGSAPPA